MDYVLLINTLAHTHANVQVDIPVQTVQHALLVSYYKLDLEFFKYTAQEFFGHISV